MGGGAQTYTFAPPPPLSKVCGGGGGHMPPLPPPPPSLHTPSAIVSVKLLSNNLTTLCLNGTLSCVDFMLVIMGDIPGNYRSRQKIYRPILRIYTSIAGPYPGGGGGGRGGRTTPTPTPTPYTSRPNFRVPPAHRFHKYKLRLLYFRMQKLTPYSINFIKRILEEHADDARHSPAN